MRATKSTILIIFTLIVLAGCVNIPIGDGNKLKGSKERVTFTDDKGDEHSVTIDEDGKSVKFEEIGEDGEEGDMAFGKNLEIPENFPKDIPLAKDANVQQASSLEENVSISYSTHISANKLSQMYDDFFNNGSFEEEPTIIL